MPAPHTHRDVIVEIARRAQIPIDSIADELDRPAFSRGQAIFGYAGDEINRVAKNYPNMRWWISESGLVMAILSPQEILQQRPAAELIAERAARRQAVVMPILEKQGWTRGKLATKSGVSNGPVYEYLNGKREWISFENGKAIADALDLAVTELPDVRPRE